MWRLSPCSVVTNLAAAKASVLSYRFLVVGEGIEKKQADFAAEVAAMSQTAA